LLLGQRLAEKVAHGQEVEVAVEVAAHSAAVVALVADLDVAEEGAILLTWDRVPIDATT
jgi:hypothetical protein